MKSGRTEPRDPTKPKFGDNQGQWAVGIVPPEVTEYVDWLLDPNRQGTKTEFADHLGVHHDTLYKWDKDDRVKKLIDDQCRAMSVNAITRQRVVNAMADRAQKGDTQAAKIWLAYSSQFLPPPERQVTDRKLDDMSDDELRLELAQHLEEE